MDSKKTIGVEVSPFKAHYIGNATIDRVLAFDIILVAFLAKHRYVCSFGVFLQDGTNFGYPNG